MKNPKWVRAGKKAAEARRRNKIARHRDFVRRFKEADKNEKLAVTMAKLGIRQAVARAPWPHWQLLTFAGAHGGEARGVVDMIAIRKDHGEPYPGTNRGDTFQIILIQIKSGQAAWPTDNDLNRLRKAAKRHGACGILLAKWKKGKSAKFFSLATRARDWEEVTDLTEFFK